MTLGRGQRRKVHERSRKSDCEVEYTSDRQAFFQMGARCGEITAIYRVQGQVAESDVDEPVVAEPLVIRKALLQAFARLSVVSLPHRHSSYLPEGILDQRLIPCFPRN